jgi:hypothetical protein
LYFVFRSKRATTSALFSAALTIAAEAKTLDAHDSEEYADRIQTCFSFFEYVKDHSALASRVLGKLRTFCAEVSSHECEIIEEESI